MTAVEDQELFSTFQPEIQKYLEDVGPLEKYKTPASLKKLLEKLRFDLVVPPWHPVTDYIRSYANGCSIGAITSDNAWCRCNRKTTGTIKDTGFGKRTWVNIHIFHKDPEKGVAERYLSVEPHAGYIWDLTSEHMLENSMGYVPTEYTNAKRKRGGRHSSRIMVNRQTIFDKAMQLLKQGTFEGELEHHPKQYKRKKDVQPEIDSEPGLFEDLLPETHAEEENEELERRKIKLPLFTDADMRTLKFMHAIACKEYPALVSDFNAMYAKAEELLK